jgi:murein DD-endopeptidase MepM/ murein hydrolase activator NlpD
MLGSIMSSIGALDSVASEEVTTPEAGTFVYDAHCRFSKAPGPVEMIFAFDANGRISGLLLRPDAKVPRKEYASPFLDYRTRTTLRLPFRGEWYVFWGGRTLKQNYHAFTRDQRFAMDIVIMKDGRTHGGDGKSCADYYCYGQPVLAPAAGTVVWARDSLPDNTPGQMDPAHATGNSLVLDHGNGEYSLIAHLQPGSQRFKVGDRVPADAEIGRCGNSGNTSEPHVHYHLQNGPAPFDADGLPAQFVDLRVDGKPVDRGEIVQGQKVSRRR